MKIYLKNITALFLIFLLTPFFYAQDENLYAYRGGTADGFASENIETLTCSTPYHNYAYFGGQGDGSANEIIDNATCATPYHNYAYFGGEADGSASEILENNNCSTPPHFYAYFGGEADGFSVNKTEDICPIEAPVANFIADKTEICIGQSIQFTDTSTNKPTGWNWSFEGGTPSSSTNKVVNVIYNTAGVYQVKLTVANYIGSDTITKVGFITVKSSEECSGMGAVETDKAKTLVYPNPTKNIVYIKSADDIKNIEISDLTGRIIIKLNNTNNSKDMNVNLERLNSGVYILKTISDKKIETFKVIKRD